MKDLADPWSRLTAPEPRAQARALKHYFKAAETRPILPKDIVSSSAELTQLADTPALEHLKLVFGQRGMSVCADCEPGVRESIAALAEQDAEFLKVFEGFFEFVLKHQVLLKVLCIHL